MVSANASKSRVVRCEWALSDPIMIEYHDTVWGVPEHDDTSLFENLVLDGFQAGLSWLIVLRKRENFRKAFDGFDPRRVAKYGSREIRRLTGDAGIIRNRLKIAATVRNAQAFLDVQKEFGTFDRFVWSFTGGKPLKNRRKGMGDIPARSKESDAMSRELQRRGFSFVGSTICYAFMQAVGIVNDHVMRCFRYDEL
jgi:DNA-3-methyladenine glycosylase I